MSMLDCSNMISFQGENNKKLGLCQISWLTKMPLNAAVPKWGPTEYALNLYTSDVGSGPVT